MDRSTAKRQMNEFTITSDLTDPRSFELANRIERQAAQALRAIDEAGKIFKRVAVDQATGQRTVTMAYQGNAQVRTAMQQAMAIDPARYGLGEGEAMPISISQQRTANWQYTRERFTDPRVRAAAMEKIIRGGGTANYNKETGFVEYVAPQDVTKVVRREATLGDKRYMAGMSSASALAFGSSDAKPHEREYALLERSERKRVARVSAMKEFVRRNPKSGLAMAQRAKKASGAKALARSVSRSAFTAMVSLLATATTVLWKILGGVLETAKNTSKTVNDAATLNMDQKAVALYRNMGTNFNNDSELFTDIMKGMVSKYSNVGASQFSGSVTEAAKFLQKSTGAVLRMVAEKKNDPAGMFNELMAETLNITASGRGGLQEGLSMNDARSRNIDIVRGLWGDKYAELFAGLSSRLVSDSILRPGATFTPDRVSELLNRYYGTGAGEGKVSMSNPVVVGDTDRNSATRALQTMNANVTVFKGIGDTLLTKLIPLVAEILTVLRNFARPLLKNIAPDWVAQEQSTAMNLNRQIRGDMLTRATASAEQLRPYMGGYKGSAFSFGSSAAKLLRKGASDPEVRSALGISLEELNKMKVENPWALLPFMDIEDLDASLSVDLGGGMRGTPMPSESRYTPEGQAQRARDIAFAAALARSDKTNAMTGAGNASPLGRLASNKTGMARLGAWAAQNKSYKTIYDLLVNANGKTSVELYEELNGKVKESDIAGLLQFAEGNWRASEGDDKRQMNLFVMGLRDLQETLLNPGNNTTAGVKKLGETYGALNLKSQYSTLTSRLLETAMNSGVIDGGQDFAKLSGTGTINDGTLTIIVKDEQGNVKGTLSTGVSDLSGLRGTVNMAKGRVVDANANSKTPVATN